MFRFEGTKNLGELLEWLGGVYQVGLVDEEGGWLRDVGSKERGLYEINTIDGTPNNMNVFAWRDGVDVELLVQRLRNTR